MIAGKERKRYVFSRNQKKSSLDAKRTKVANNEAEFDLANVLPK